MRRGVRRHPPGKGFDEVFGLDAAALDAWLSRRDD